MDLATLSRLLWREREMLDTLQFKLDEQQLLLAGGHAEWVARASAEVEAVLARIGELELTRAVEFDRAAEQLGLAPAPSLRHLATVAPEPWGHLLEEHHKALVAQIARVQRTTETNRGLARSAVKAAATILASIDGDPAQAGTYEPSGQTDSPARRPALVDEEM